MVWLALAVLVIAAFWVPRLGKALLVLIGIALVGSFGFWVYTTHEHERQYVTPVRQTTLDGIALGQHEDDVLLAKGKPQEGGRFMETLTYQANASSPITFVGFRANFVTRVYKYPASDFGSEPDVRPDSQMRGYYAGASAEVLERLGLNFHKSVSADRLTEARTWSDYNIAFHVAAGRIVGICLTERPFRFAKEHRYEVPSWSSRMSRGGPFGRAW